MTARAGAPHLRFWPKGVPHEVHGSRATLPEYLDFNARRFPDKAAIVYCGAVTRYAQLKRSVDALSDFLVDRLGVKQGDRVLLMSQNCPQFVIAFYATLRAGGVVVPVSPMSKAAEIGYYREDSGARVAFVAQELLGHVPDGMFDAVVVHAYVDALDAEAGVDADLAQWVGAPRQALASPHLHAFERAAAPDGAQRSAAAFVGDADDLAVLPYTSGTTGHPKGCRHTHATLLASLGASQVWRELHAESVVLAAAPLFHMLGLQNGMNMPLTLGGTAVLMPRWHAAAAGRLIERHAVTAWAAPPAMVLDLFAAPETEARDLSSLVLLAGGGAAMPQAVAAMLEERHGLAYNEGYGLTETAAFLLANPLLRGKRQCLGMPTQGVDARIVDPTTLAEVPLGQEGELVVHGAQLMLGYWQRPEADAESFVVIDAKRFLRTGDLAVMDDEGYFFLRDRLKRMINVSGYKVWPAEIETAMYAHPAVHEACVVGVPDGRRGEAVKALVVLKPAARGTVDAAQVIAWARERMAAYKAPRVVEFVDSLPKSGTGKILWRELQERERRRAV